MLVVASVVAVPGLVGEARRPWVELDALVRAAEGVLAGAMTTLPASDRDAMAAFALASLDADPDGAAAFVAALEGGRPDPEGNPAPPTEAWSARLDADPRAFVAFQRARHTLAIARDAANRIGLAANDVYLTVDTGVAPDGFFRDHIAFVVGAHPWWEEPIAPGQAFDVAAIDGLHWRASYLPDLGGKPGSFGRNPAHDPILPRFERDEWGTWYSVWVSERGSGTAVLALTMDIEASSVRRAMTAAAQRSAAMIALLAVVVVVVARLVASWVSRPVAALQQGAHAVIAARYEHRVPRAGARELVELIDTFNRMLGDLAQRVNLLRTLEKLLSKELAEAAAKDGLQLGGKEAECTVVFTDFANFTGLTANMRAADVVRTLNEYFTVLIPIIKRHGGFVDKYIGDAIVAFFGAPIPIPNHADRAVQCAIAMQRAMREINARRASQGLVTFQMRVGLNSGEVVVGAIGCDEKLEYTSIGETTNLAQRMESASPVGHACLASGTRSRLRDALPSDVTLDPEVPLKVKGYASDVPASRLWVGERAGV